MFLGRVIGRVVPAVVTAGMEGIPLLWVQPLDKHGEPEGQPFVSADGTRMAGPGEMVYWEASREAALTLEPSFVPVDHAVVGIVDDLFLDEPPPKTRRRGRKRS
jgi:ethanolamine utilization protein EutN